MSRVDELVYELGKTRGRNLDTPTERELIALADKLEAENVELKRRIAEEREECAKVGDRIAEEINDWHWPDRSRYEPSKAEVASLVAEQIRARGTK